MYHGNNLPVVFSPPESTFTLACTKYNYYYYEFNLHKILMVKFSPQDQVVNLVKYFPGENYLLLCLLYTLFTPGRSWVWPLSPTSPLRSSVEWLSPQILSPRSPTGSSRRYTQIHTHTHTHTNTHSTVILILYCSWEAESVWLLVLAGLLSIAS